MQKKTWVGPWLRLHRQESGRTCRDIARAVGLDPTSVSRIEIGTTRIAADDLGRFLAAYNLTPGQFAAEIRRVR